MKIDAKQPAARFTLQWFANTVPGVPLRAALKNNVVSLEWERGLEGIIMKFVCDNEISAKILQRRSKELLAAAQAGYLAQTDMHISAVEITFQKP